MTTGIRRPPLVILGIDAGDPGFVQRWAQEGYLPTIASIMERGCWGRTAGPELISEHGVWVSLLSGVSRSQHGYYYFRQLKPGTYDLQTVTARDLNVLPFWSYLRGQERKTAIIDAPEVQPMPGLQGIQLANWATHNNWNPYHYAVASEPPDLLLEVRQNFGPKLVMIEKNESTLDEDKQMYRQLLDRIERKSALCRSLLTRDRFDLIVAVFAESHAASHQFWKYWPERQDGARGKEDSLCHAIRDVYQAIDRQLGLLLAQLPQESNVFIVSSVGVDDYYPTTGLIEAFFRQLGYQASPDSSDISLRPMALVRRMIPEAWRIALSRQLPRDTRERLLADQFRSGTNWCKTTAFAIPAFYMSFVRVNLKGREPEGTVQPGAEYHHLLDRIEDDLSKLVDPETGERAITRVAKTVELFPPDPSIYLPDMFVEWKTGRFMQRVVHPRAELVQKKPDFYRPSDHSSSGFVAAAGPSIQKREALGDIQVLDLAPTFLSLMGEPIPQRMAGRAIEAVIRS